MEYKQYEIHDNYDLPFIVNVYPGNKVGIKHSDNTENRDRLVITCEKIFIGKSKLCPMTEYSGGYGSKFNGNTILLRIDKLTYVWIGSEIIKFKTPHRIVKFTSPIGNNDFPYPWAKDSHGNIYLMVDKIMLPKTNTDDPYQYYYFDSERISPVKRKKHKPVQWRDKSGREYQTTPMQIVKVICERHGKKFKKI